MLSALGAPPPVVSRRREDVHHHGVCNGGNRMLDARRYSPTASRMWPFPPLKRRGNAAVWTATVPGGGASKTNMRRFRRCRLAKRALVRNRITPRWGEEGCGLKRGGFKRAGADFPPLGKRGDYHEDGSLRSIGHSASWIRLKRFWRDTKST